MDGILLVDKPAGISSAEVVRRVKARVKPLRVGHLGTLDPSATGLLPIMIGEGTKLAAFLEHQDKEYEGRIQLGAETDTLDRDGEVVRTAPVPVLDAERLAEVAARFTGEITQTPPVYSAIKRDGVPLYKLARRGDAVAPPQARTVHVARLELRAEEGDSLRFSVTSSAGFYVRSLARDIGIALGTAAHLAELRRIRSSGFSIADACSLDETLIALEGDGVVDLVGLRRALAAMPEVTVDEALERRLRNGDSSTLLSLVPPQGGLFKVVCNETLVAMARAQSRVTATIVRVFAPPSHQRAG